MRRAVRAVWLRTGVAACLLVGLASSAACSRRTERRPSVLLVSVDTLRADRLSYAGHDRPTSPNLDKLARESNWFSDVIAQAPSTAASHKSMLTSLYPSVHRHTSRRTSPSVNYSIASILRYNGYHTAGFVDGGYLAARFGFNLGFDVYDDGGGEKRPRVGIGRLGLAGIRPNVKKWLETRPMEKPFFLFVHTYDVHCPYTPPEPYFSRYSSWYKGGVQVVGGCGSTHFNDRGLSDDDFRYISDLYDGGVAYMDNELNELLDLFRAAALYDDMMIIVTSDHGESLGERGYVGHNRKYEEQLRIPLLWRLPDGQARGRIDAPAQSVDILPTLCDLLGIDPKVELQGASLAGLMRDGGGPDRGRMRLSEGQFGHAVRFDQRFKLLVTPRRDYDLFDLQADPLELDPLGDSGREKAREIFGRYKSWLRESAAIHGRYEKTVRVEVDDETRGQLEELGYVGSE